MPSDFPRTSKVLIANRGEIACRIIRTCRRLGIRTVAVFSEADTQSLAVRLADEAVAIGPAPARQSYLNIERILEAAARTGATAIHPGYGFLSESEEFAARVGAAGLIWIGPAPAIIRDMGNKDAARQRAAAAGLDVLGGSRLFREGENHTLLAEAATTGFPLLVKAAFGGGGIGMSRVDAGAQLLDVAERTQRLAARAFGDGAIYLEKYLCEPRHIEVQVFGFGDGRVLILGDRDCSIQRRHQKVIEEAPVAAISDSQRSELWACAQRFAASEHYANAGTLEFLLDGGGRFYFLEMNTRLQVEHPVTEMTINLDLVELQLRLALLGPESITLTQVAIDPAGHAVECRLYAEDPQRNFLPAPGTLETFALPDAIPNLRIDTGVTAGDTITPHYDPMLAKIIAWGANREAALATLRDGLRAIDVRGIKTNLELLRRIAEFPAYVERPADTGFVERHLPALLKVS